jgi:hypothetical protein
MTQIGMSRVLVDDGVDVVQESAAPEIVSLAERIEPDAVVLRLGDGETQNLADRVREVAPSATLILWALDETAMEVFDPGSPVPRRVPIVTPDALLNELKNATQARQGE